MMPYSAALLPPPVGNHSTSAMLSSSRSSGGSAGLPARSIQACRLPGGGFPRGQGREVGDHEDDLEQPPCRRGYRAGAVQPAAGVHQRHGFVGADERGSDPGGVPGEVVADQLQAAAEPPDLITEGGPVSFAGAPGTDR